MNRHPDYTFAMEYDAWESAPLQQTGPATFAGEVTLPAKPDTLDFVTVHQHTANGSTLTLSSPLLRAKLRMMPRFRSASWIAVVACVTSGALRRGGSRSAEQAEFFEKKIRPLLVERCYECHPRRRKTKGGLSLDSREAVLQGRRFRPGAGRG